MRERESIFAPNIHTDRTTRAPRIERAHCLELGRVIGIDEARRIVVDDHRSDPLHFECAEPACAGRGVRIAGVNYRFEAEERPKFVSNHFRRLDDHEPTCPYFASEAAGMSEPASNGSRRARALRRDLIEEFVPPSTRASKQVEPFQDPDETANDKPPPTRRARRNRFASTSSLARLIDSYRALVASQVPNAVRDYLIRVRGIGQVSLAEYVTPIYRAQRLSHPHVIYGGARWVKSYGTGFKLRFIDRIGLFPVFVYVPPTVAVAGTWQEALCALREGGYCTAYVLGVLRAGRDEASLSIDAVSAGHLVLHKPQPRNRSNTHS